MRTWMMIIAGFACASLANAADSAATKTAEDCTAAAALTFKAYGDAKSKPNASYTTHYNHKNHHCFILITDKGKGADGYYYTYKSLEEAFENSQYAGYVYSTAPHAVPNYKPADPCHITLPDGEVKTCYSEADFDKAAALFMK